MSDTTGGIRRSVHKPLTFNTYIHKTLKKVQPHTQISNIAKRASTQLDMFIKILSSRLASLAIQISQSGGHHTINVKDVEIAAHLLLPGELCRAAIDKGQQAVMSFDQCDSIKNKANRCGLAFPPHISEKFLRLQDSAGDTAISRLYVAKRAPVYMAAIIEHLVSEILIVCGEQCRSFGKQTINVRHLLLATRADENINILQNVLDINWLGGGVIPEINKAIIPTKEKQQQLAIKRRNARKENKAKTPRRSLPGSKALRDIKRYQKTCGLLQLYEHFNRFVREQTDEYWGDTIHFGAKVIEYLQLYIEDRVVFIFKEAVRAMVHADRETVEARDIEFVWSFIRPAGKISYTIVGTDNLADPGVRRLAFRGGVKRIGETCYPVIREIMAFYVARILQAAVLLMQRQKKKTITLYYLRSGASALGINLPIDVTKRKTKKLADSGEDSE